jgi:phosphate transport system substrate-binding protein
MNDWMRAVLAMCVAMLVIVPAARAQDVTLSGSGASFPYPFYAKLFSEYNKVNPGVKINYASVGSGTGIKQISDKTTDFGASDAPMTDAQLKAAQGGDLLHIPMTLGAVVPIYNVPGVTKPLVFSGAVLADIFRGKITAWNDPAIAKLNPGVKLPDAGITVVHRSDGSGTTYVFTEYLSKASADFAKAPGKGTAVNWPVDDKVGAKGNEGVAGVVGKTPGTIGYAELIYAMQNRIAFGDVQNAAGKAIHASLEGVTAAAASQTNPPADLRMSITNAPGDAAYPISAFTYILVYKNQADASKGKALTDFLKWAVTDGQRYAADLHYAPLPDNVVKADQAKIDSIVVK